MNKPPTDDDSLHLALIQEMWRELQAARKDPLKYEGVAERIRKEADLLRQRELSRSRSKATTLTLSH